ncbi:MAG: LysR family transcriptional regulator [Oligoflexia bacterium]|nr:LysR family transcriptional regulator [Oligoflexia bacterium]
MQTDQLNGLIALKAVADKKSFTDGAELLGVSTSAVSQSIKQLEARLGVALLARTTRSISLTEAGARFLDQAGPALEQILSAMENVGSYAEHPSGLLRLNLPRAAYLNLMEPLITSFIKKYPEVTVDVFFDDDLSDIVGSGFDAGIRLSEMMAKDMVTLKLLGPVRFVVAGSPKYFNKMGRPKHPKDLLSHNCIRMRVGTNELYDRWEFEDKGKDFQVQVSGSLIFNDSILVVNAALQGAGITYCVEERIRDKIESGKLEVVLGQYAAISGGFHLYYPKRSQVLPKLRAFVDHIKSESSKTK